MADTGARRATALSQCNCRRWLSCKKQLDVIGDDLCSKRFVISNAQIVRRFLKYANGRNSVPSNDRPPVLNVTVITGFDK